MNYKKSGSVQTKNLASPTKKAEKKPIYESKTRPKTSAYSSATHNPTLTKKRSTPVDPLEPDSGKLGSRSSMK